MINIDSHYRHFLVCSRSPLASYRELYKPTRPSSFYAIPSVIRKPKLKRNISWTTAQYAPMNEGLVTRKDSRGLRQDSSSSNGEHTAESNNRLSAEGVLNYNHVLSSNAAYATRKHWPVLRTVSETTGQDTLSLTRDTNVSVTAAKKHAMTSTGDNLTSYRRFRAHAGRLLCCCSRPSAGVSIMASDPEPRPPENVEGERTETVGRPQRLHLFHVQGQRPCAELPSIPALEDDEHLYSRIKTPQNGNVTRFKVVTAGDGGYETVVEAETSEVQMEHPIPTQRSNLHLPHPVNTAYHHLQWKRESNRTYDHLQWPAGLDVSKDDQQSVTSNLYSTLERSQTSDHGDNDYDHLQCQRLAAETESLSTGMIQDGIPFDSTVLITICLFGKQGKETPIWHQWLQVVRSSLLDVRATSW